MSRIDDKFAALRGQGFTGSLSDMTLQWLQFNGATSNSVTDAWLEVLALFGYFGERNDQWYAALDGLGYGYLDHISDREAQFWADGGVIGIPLPPIDPDNVYQGTGADWVEIGTGAPRNYQAPWRAGFLLYVLEHTGTDRGLVGNTTSFTGGVGQTNWQVLLTLGNALLLSATNELAALTNVTSSQIISPGRTYLVIAEWDGADLSLTVGSPFEDAITDSLPLDYTPVADHGEYRLLGNSVGSFADELQLSAVDIEENIGVDEFRLEFPCAEGSGVVSLDYAQGNHDGVISTDAVHAARLSPATAVYVFDGIDMHAIMDDWIPLGVPFSIELRAIPLTVDGAARRTLHGAAGGTPLISGIESTNLWRQSVINVDGLARPASNALTAVPGSAVKLLTTGAASGSATDANGVVASDSVAVDPLATAVGSIGAVDGGANPFHGPIWDAELIDGSPIQDTDVLVGDGVRYISIPDFVIPAGDDFEVSCDWIREDTGAVYVGIFGNAGNGNTLLIMYGAAGNDDVWMRDDDSSEVLLGRFDGALADIAMGQHVHVRLGVTAGQAFLQIDDGPVLENAAHAWQSFTLSQIGSRATNGRLPIGSSLQNVTAENTTTGQFVTYKTNEGSGIEVLAYDKAGDPLPLLDGTVVPDATWNNIPANSRHYPMDDGKAAAGTLRDIIGGHDATIINYNPAAWVLDDTIPP